MTTVGVALLADSGYHTSIAVDTESDETYRLNVTASSIVAGFQTEAPASAHAVAVAFSA